MHATEFSKCFLYNSKDNNFWCAFDISCVNLASDNSAVSILIISEIKRTHEIHKKDFPGRKRVCVNIPCIN